MGDVHTSHHHASNPVNQGEHWAVGYRTQDSESQVTVYTLENKKCEL